MELVPGIKSRRSVREFRDREVSQETVEEVLEAGRWAPSGRNTEPWRFVVSKAQETRSELAAATSRKQIREAPVTIAILRDLQAGYDQLKDLQAIGACVQNILLAAHGLGLGACWLGVTKDAKAERILGVTEGQELMAIVALGHPVEKERDASRLPLECLVNYLE